MHSLILQEPGRLVYADTPAPKALQPGESLVRVGRIGICGTDLHAYRGRQPFFTYPRILGHELGVEVVETAGPAGGLKPGDRCSVEPYLNCGACIACRRGKPNCCTQLRVLGVHTDGGMREYLVVPTHKLHKSRILSLERLALVETLGIGAHAVARAGITPDDAVLVIGAGPIGLAVTQFAQLTGAAVAVMDQNAARLAFCRRQMHVPRTIAANEDPAPQLLEVFGGELPTVVLDATGNAQSMMRAFEYAAHGGKLVYVGLFQGDVTFPDPLFHRKELTLLASRNATPGDFTHIIRLMETGRIDTTPWITHRVPFGEMAAAFPGWLAPDSGVIKAMVEIGASGN